MFHQPFDSNTPQDILYQFGTIGEIATYGNNIHRYAPSFMRNAKFIACDVEFMKWANHHRGFFFMHYTGNESDDLLRTLVPRGSIPKEVNAKTVMRLICLKFTTKRAHFDAGISKRMLNFMLVAKAKNMPKSLVLFLFTHLF
jgi:hypothetical protein